MSTAVAGKGLEGIVAANSGICWIDGDAGILSYRGIDIHELAVHSSFEETTYLLWFGRLPNEAELQDFTAQLAASRVIDPAIIALLKSFPPGATPMEVLRTAVSALSMYDVDEADNLHDSNVRKAFRLTSQIGMIVAIYDRLRKGLELVEPDPTLTHAANFLWMLNGEKPSETATKTLDVALILHADHELNASTFAARVIAATLSDIHSAVTGAIGALKGPLHGGANEAVMRMLYAINDAGADPVEYVKAMLAAKKKVSGFGHRVYKTEDPRATHLRRMSEQLSKDSGVTKWYDWSRAIELFINAEKHLNANVDFYSA
jgi:citrate synthase